MSTIRLVLSCGAEPRFDSLVLDAYGIEDGETGWCDEHPEATVDAIVVDEDPSPTERAEASGS